MIVKKINIFFSLSLSQNAETFKHKKLSLIENKANIKERWAWY